MQRRAHARVFVTSAALALSIAPAAAQTPADFYKGKTISILMGTGPGGSYDLYGRTIAEHLGRHIPGRPNIVILHIIYQSKEALETPILIEQVALACFVSPGANPPRNGEQPCRNPTVRSDPIGGAALLHRSLIRIVTGTP